jgi:serine/threonine protein kinase/tetratricopeptide (TPR) repeat protein
MVGQSDKLRALFCEALERKTPQEQAAYLDQACRDRPELRARIEALLQAHQDASGFLDEPSAARRLTVDEPVAEKPGTVIGPYKLLQQIGEGGMGVVYMAEQTSPVQRKVALKIIKPGMDSHQVIARFEAERQALALMDHPNIAKVLDAGTTTGESDGASGGRPYFVMELVKGVPITRYCDERRLTPRERLELFVPVCQAIQHAHQKGIIHRDLKPSNALIAHYDGKPVPKVIDFGVAKATGPKLTERTLFTEYGSIIGTLEYMSPEQAELNQLDIDTRSDIYSLGVILYQLLTGTTPLEAKRLKESSLLEVLRMIREEEPPKPSTRLNTTVELPTIAADRGAEPHKLRGLVRGELDWIVMKCLEKDRNRRYETANGLVRDIERYLRDEPVQACPPSVWYRFRKFARRNKTALVVATLLFVASAASTIMVWQERQEALRQRDTAQSQREAAETNLRKARQAVHDYFTLVSENELLTRPTLEPLRKQLLQAALRYNQDFVRGYGDNPELEAELAASYLLITRLTHDVSPDEDWLVPFEKGVNLVEDLLARRPEVLASQSFESGVRWMNSGVGFHTDRPEDCLRIFEKARSLWEQMLRDHPTATGLQNDLAAFYLVIGMLDWTAFDQPTKAVSALQKSCDLYRQLVAANPRVGHYRGTLAISLGNLGIGLAMLGRLPEAVSVCREAQAAAQKLVADSPEVPGWRDLLTSLTYQHYAMVLQHADRFAEAEAVYRQIVAGQEALGHDYPTVVRYRNRLFLARLQHADLLWFMGRLAQATEEYRQALSLVGSLGPEIPDCQENVAWFLATCADPHFRDAPKALALAKRNLEQMPESPASYANLGAAYYCAGDFQAVVQAMEKTPAILQNCGSAALFVLAMAHWHLGEKALARTQYDQAVARLEKYELRFPDSLRLRDEARNVLGISEPNK